MVKQYAPKIVWILFFLFSAVAVQAGVPVRPNVGDLTGTDFVALARASMESYLDARTPAADIIRSAAFATCKRTYPVSISLRKQGKLVARSQASGGTLASNTLTAARLAMRSEGLGNIVTLGDLQSLTVGVEVIGDPQPMLAIDTKNALIPGYWGLLLRRGQPDPGLVGMYASQAVQRSEVFPSTSYTQGFSSDRMRRQCLADLDRMPESKGLKVQGYRFATLYYVGRPGQLAMLLYRGKILKLDPVLPGSKVAAKVAASVANQLVRRVAAKGPLSLPGDKTGNQTTCALSAAWALARYSRAHPNDTSVRLAAQKILEPVGERDVRLRKTEQDGYVHVDEEGTASIRATALFVLAIGELPHQPQAATIQRRMARWLRSQLDADGQIELPDGKSHADRKTIALVVLALLATGSDSSNVSIVAAMDYLAEALQSGSTVAKAGAKVDAETLSWIGRAILAARGGPEGRYYAVLEPLTTKLIDQQHVSGLADAVGGFDGPDGSLDAATTAGALIVLNGYADVLKKAKMPGRIFSLRSAAGRAGRFCRQMLYRPHEAYFAPEPEEYYGAARKTPSAAQPSLESTAAILHAMIEE